MTSKASLDAQGLTICLDWRGVVFGLSRREFRIPRADITSVRAMKSKQAIHLLRFRMAGTAVPGWWLMGWFTRSTRDGRRAWVWITPRRDLIVIETIQKNRSLVIVPRDWFAEPPAVSGSDVSPTDG